jgi:hypothetical protein
MEGELSLQARAALDGELVLLVRRGEEEGTLYTHEAFIGAYQQALLDRIEHSVPPGVSSRCALRAVGRLRSPFAHQATLVDALARLRKLGTPVDPATLDEHRHHVVAVFPVHA